jgi:Holliday junction resolvase RusA-like endonuclease
MISFKVMGKAVPQGSKKAFVNPKTGRAVITEQAGKRLKDWRKLITEEAEGRLSSPLLGPVGVTLSFYLPHPKKHYRKVDGVSVLKDDAPTYISNRSVGDIDKLTRAVLDALDDADVFGDDSQVSALQVTRMYTDGDPNVYVVVYEMHNDDGMQ